MKVRAFSELTMAEALLSNWKWLPGSQVKLLITHLINSLDAIASYMLDKDTVIDRAYLVLSSVRLFTDVKVEHEFYDTYFFLKNLLRKDMQRINPDNIRVIGAKTRFIADQNYFQLLISNVKEILSEVFQ
jgi:hypothetical protein